MFERFRTSIKVALINDLSLPTREHEKGLHHCKPLDVVRRQESNEGYYIL